MSDHPEVDERSETLMRNAAAVFWENYFHKPFPATERRPSLPSIPEKLKERSVEDFNPSSPMNALVSSARPTTGVVNKHSLKNPAKSSMKQAQRTLRAASLDEEDSLTVRPRSSVFSRAEEVKRTCSNDAYDSAKSGRVNRALPIQKRLPKLARENSLPSLAVTQQRAVDAILRADIIHCRREGSLDELDELDDQVGFSLSGKSECASVKGSSSRSNGESFPRGSISRSNSSKSGPCSKNSTPSTSRRNSLTAEAEAASFMEMIESSPALQDAIAANMLLPSFARNTISSLIQQTRSAELCAQASQLIASEKIRNMKKQA